MPLSKDQMREYMRRKRAEKAGKVYIPVSDCKPEQPPTTNAVNQSKPCPNCQAEYQRGYQDGLLAGDPVLRAIRAAKNGEGYDKAEPLKSVVDALGEAEKEPELHKTPIIRNISDVAPAIQRATPASHRTWFRPVSKQDQLRNAGKPRSKFTA